MHVAITLWAIMAAWRWGDWKNFRHYHATMLYMPAMNLFYLYLTMGYPLWKIQPGLGLSYTTIVCLYSFIIFPCTVIVFLSNYPTTFREKIFHIGKWIFIYIGVEYIAQGIERITYYHGWNLGCSFLFLIIMFPMLRLHFKKPVYAYTLSFFIIILLLNLFDIPWNIPVEERL